MSLSENEGAIWYYIHCVQACPKVLATSGFNCRLPLHHARGCVFLLVYHVPSTLSDLMKIISLFLQITQYTIQSSFPKSNLILKTMCYQSLYFFNPKLFTNYFECTNGKCRLGAERRTEAGSYPVIFPLFGLPTAPQEDLPSCGFPSKRGLENRPRTWPLRNRQMLQRGVLSGHPN